MSRRTDGRPHTPEPIVVSLSWAAERLEISVETARALARRDELPGAFLLGTRWRVSTVVFRQAIEERARARANHPSASSLAPVATIHPPASASRAALVRRRPRGDVS